MNAQSKQSQSEQYAKWLDSDANPLPFIQPENSFTYKLLKDLLQFIN